MGHMDSFYRAVVYGLVAHVVLYFLIILIHLPPLTLNPTTKNLVEFDVKSVKKLDNKAKPDRQLVRETELPKEILKDDTEEVARFLSLQQKRVREQTRALKTGLTKNRSSEAAPAKQTSQTIGPPDIKSLTPKIFSQKSQVVDAREKAKKGLADFQPELNANLPSKPGFSEAGLSTLGESLPDNIQIGTFTALNTDRYLYYSFFARIDEAIRFRWESRIKSVMDRVAAQLRFTSTEEWVTLVEIQLKPNGEFSAAEIMKKSGIDGFDIAPGDSFQEARVFPHPPKELVDSDGIIRLRYSFRVFFDPKTYVRRHD